jgi:8-oxo-dGTP diphosphatase
MEAELFPAADRPIITALRLSDRMLITGPDPTRVNEFLERLAWALAAGVCLVQLRAPGLDAEAYRALAAAAAELCRRHGARMLVNPPVDTLEPPEGMGLHLSSRRLLAARERPPGGASLVGASCHNAEELGRAQSLGLDYALLSSVLPTASHPHAAPLGWEKFAELVDRAALPVYALGGMTPRHIATARQCGGQGIAAIGGLWSEAV